jgi:hypothetical protein
MTYIEPNPSMMQSCLEASQPPKIFQHTPRSKQHLSPVKFESYPLIRPLWIASAIGWEIWFWNKIWQRKDQNIHSYAAYLASEEELSEE